MTDLLSTRLQGEGHARARGAQPGNRRDDQGRCGQEAQLLTGQSTQSQPQQMKAAAVGNSLATAITMCWQVSRSSVRRKGLNPTPLV